MPDAPKPFCKSYPRCFARVDGVGYCNVCRPRYNATKQRSNVKREYCSCCRKFYRSKLWQWLRNEALYKMPICSRCRSQFDLHVDHIVARHAGGADDLANLQTLCRQCHSIKTASEDGGFGNDVVT